MTVNWLRVEDADPVKDLQRLWDRPQGYIFTPSWLEEWIHRQIKLYGDAKQRLLKPSRSDGRKKRRPR